MRMNTPSLTHIRTHIEFALFLILLLSRTSAGLVCRIRNIVVIYVCKFTAEWYNKRFHLIWTLNTYETQLYTDLSVADFRCVIAHVIRRNLGQSYHAGLQSKRLVNMMEYLFVRRAFLFSPAHHYNIRNGFFREVLQHQLFYQDLCVTIAQCPQ